MHAPWKQPPSTQSLVQLPQCLGSVLRLTHAPLQSVYGSAQTHSLSSQLKFVGHASPQPPQLSLLVLTLTQIPEQSVWSAGQQLPFVHCVRSGQTVPQVPQLARSVLRLTQSSPQRVSPATGHGGR